MRERVYCEECEHAEKKGHPVDPEFWKCLIKPRKQTKFLVRNEARLLRYCELRNTRGRCRYYVKATEGA